MDEDQTPTSRGICICQGYSRSLTIFMSFACIYPQGTQTSYLLYLVAEQGSLNGTPINIKQEGEMRQVLELISVEFLLGLTKNGLTDRLNELQTDQQQHQGCNNKCIVKKVINFFFIVSSGCTPVIIIISLAASSGGAAADWLEGRG